MSDISINYKGEAIATMDASGTKTLGTEGKYCEDDIEVVGREFFTLDGKKVNHLESQEVYIMKVYDAKGQTHTMKIIKD